MSNTKIEWTTKRWNPITGCTPISAGCDHCYARRMAQRLAGRFGYPADDPFRVTFHPDRLELPLHWRKPSKIFVNSMGDLMHSKVAPSLISRILTTIALCPDHTFQILTKRPENILNKTHKFYNSYAMHGIDYLPNIWLGVTVESAKHKDRIDVLRTIPAAVRFVSFEPLLGDVGELDLTGIHWVIVGGETGLGARQMHSHWSYNIFDQCIQAKVPFFFKTWGSFYSDRQKSIGQTIINGREWREFPQIR